MDAQYFIDKFEPIPEEKWGIGALQLANNSRCALGHCFGDRLDEYPNKHIEIFSHAGLYDIPSKPAALCNLFSRCLSASVVEINDGHSSAYQQETPKQRILAALRDIQTLEQQNKAVEEAKEALAQETELV